jgi:hypothetical protein
MMIRTEEIVFRLIEFLFGRAYVDKLGRKPKLTYLENIYKRKLIGFSGRAEMADGSSGACRSGRSVWATRPPPDDRLIRS